MDLPANELRVLQVTPSFAPNLGGLETHVAEVVKRLPAYGIQVGVLTVDRTRQLPHRETIDGIIVERVAAYPSGRDWRFSPDLRKAIGGGRWHVVHVQSYHSFVPPMAMLAALQYRIPYVVTFHGGGATSPLRRLVRPMQLRCLSPLLRRAQLLIAVANFEIHDYGRSIGVASDKFVRIPNGTELDLDIRLTPSDGPLIVSLGRLERYKGHGRVVAALPHVLEKEPTARLWIAGDGPFRPDLQRLAARLGVSDAVEIGPADRTTLLSRLKGAAVMTLLSDFETHPLAVLEAAALGVPAIVADNSGMAELAAKGFAQTVPLKAGPARHADAILRAIRGERPAPKRDGLETWDDCVEALAAAYRTVANTRDNTGT